MYQNCFFLKEESDNTLNITHNILDHQGNFKVEIEAENDGRLCRIFIGRKRLYYVGNFEGTKTFSFAVNVSDIIAEGKGCIYQDFNLDIAWFGEGLRVKNVEIKDFTCPTIFLAGDETVMDHPSKLPYTPDKSVCGWGQMLTAFLKNEVALSNHAHKSLTTESFRKEGHYSVVSQYIKPGDFFFFQFGLNDCMIGELRHDTGYRDNLTRFIDEVRAQGSFPVLVTPMAGNTWKEHETEYEDLLYLYAEETLKLGKELSVPVLDLHQKSREAIALNGKMKAEWLFAAGNSYLTNDDGAYLMASFVADEIKSVLAKSKIAAFKQLARCVEDE